MKRFLFIILLFPVLLYSQSVDTIKGGFVGNVTISGLSALGGDQWDVTVNSSSFLGGFDPTTGTNYLFTEIAVGYNFFVNCTLFRIDSISDPVPGLQKVLRVRKPSGIGNAPINGLKAGVFSRTSLKNFSRLPNIAANAGEQGLSREDQNCLLNDLVARLDFLDSLLAATKPLDEVLAQGNDAGGARIVGVGPPVDSGDVVTLKYFEENLSSSGNLELDTTIVDAFEVDSTAGYSYVRIVSDVSDANNLLTIPEPTAGRVGMTIEVTQINSTFGATVVDVPSSLTPYKFIDVDLDTIEFKSMLQGSGERYRFICQKLGSNYYWVVTNIAPFAYADSEPTTTGQIVQYKTQSKAQIKDAILGVVDLKYDYEVDSIEQILASKYPLGARIVVKSSGAEYLTQNDSIPGYVTDSIAVVKTANNLYAVLPKFDFQTRWANLATAIKYADNIIVNSFDTITNNTTINQPLTFQRSGRIVVYDTLIVTNAIEANSDQHIFKIDRDSVRQRFVQLNVQKTPECWPEWFGADGTKENDYVGLQTALNCYLLQAQTGGLNRSAATVRLLSRSYYPDSNLVCHYGNLNLIGFGKVGGGVSSINLTSKIESDSMISNPFDSVAFALSIYAFDISKDFTNTTTTSPDPGVLPRDITHVVVKNVGFFGTSVIATSLDTSITTHKRYISGLSVWYANMIEVENCAFINNWNGMMIAGGFFHNIHNNFFVGNTRDGLMIPQIKGDFTTTCWIENNEFQNTGRYCLFVDTRGGSAQHMVIQDNSFEAKLGGFWNTRPENYACGIPTTVLINGTNDFRFTNNRFESNIAVHDLFILGGSNAVIAENAFSNNTTPSGFPYRASMGVARAYKPSTESDAFFNTYNFRDVQGSRPVRFDPTGNSIFSGFEIRSNIPSSAPVLITSYNEGAGGTLNDISFAQQGGIFINQKKVVVEVVPIVADTIDYANKATWTGRGLDFVGSSGMTPYPLPTNVNHLSKIGGLISYQDVNNRWRYMMVPNGGTPPQISYWNAAPTSGTHAKGDIAYKTTLNKGDYAGWLCTVAGTPGTWVPFGLMDEIIATNVPATNPTGGTNTTQASLNDLNSKIENLSDTDISSSNDSTTLDAEIAGLDSRVTAIESSRIYKDFHPVIYNAIDSLIPDTLIKGFPITYETNTLDITEVTYITNANVDTNTSCRLLYYDVSANTYTAFGSATITSSSNIAQTTGLTQTVTAGDWIYLELTSTGSEPNGISVNLKFE